MFNTSSVDGGGLVVGWCAGLTAALHCWLAWSVLQTTVPGLQAAALD